MPFEHLLGMNPAYIGGYIIGLGGLSYIEAWSNYLQGFQQIDQYVVSGMLNKKNIQSQVQGINDAMRDKLTTQCMPLSQLFAGGYDFYYIQGYFTGLNNDRFSKAWGLYLEGWINAEADKEANTVHDFEQLYAKKVYQHPALIIGYLDCCGHSYAQPKYFELIEELSTRLGSISRKYPSWSLPKRPAIKPSLPCKEFHSMPLPLPEPETIPGRDTLPRMEEMLGLEDIADLDVMLGLETIPEPDSTELSALENRSALKRKSENSNSDAYGSFRLFDESRGKKRQKPPHAERRKKLVSRVELPEFITQKMGIELLKKFLSARARAYSLNYQPAKTEATGKSGWFELRTPEGIHRILKELKAKLSINNMPADAALPSSSKEEKLLVAMQKLGFYIGYHGRNSDGTAISEVQVLPLIVEHCKKAKLQSVEQLIEYVAEGQMPLVYKTPATGWSDVSHNPPAPKLI